MADQKTIEMLIKEADMTDINCSQCMAISCNCDYEVGDPVGF